MPARIDARPTWALFAASLMIACTERGSHAPTRDIAQRGGAAIRSKAEIVITRLEVPVDAPLAAGTAASAGPFDSDTPSVVSVDANGKLVAHLNGTAVVRVPGSSAALLV